MDSCASSELAILECLEPTCYSTLDNRKEVSQQTLRFGEVHKPDLVQRRDKQKAQARSHSLPGVPEHCLYPLIWTLLFLCCFRFVVPRCAQPQAEVPSKEVPIPGWQGLDMQVVKLASPAFLMPRRSACDDGQSHHGSHRGPCNQRNASAEFHI